MPNPNDEALKQQQQQIGQQLDAKKTERDAAASRGEDTSQLDAEIKALEEQMKQVHSQQKDYREENRQQGGGRDNAPGQQKKNQ